MSPVVAYVEHPCSAFSSELLLSVPSERGQKLILTEELVSLSTSLQSPTRPSSVPISFHAKWAAVRLHGGVSDQLLLFSDVSRSLVLL